MNRYLGWSFHRIDGIWHATKVGEDPLIHVDLIALKDSIHLRERGYRRTGL